MKKIVLYFSLILFVTDVSRASLPSTKDLLDIRTPSVVAFHQDLTNADVLREKIKERDWEEEELPCLNTILEALNGSKNFTLWAVWMLDSMQIPVGQLYGSKYHFGNYDECMNPPWLKTHPQFKTQYCAADLQFTQSAKNKDLNVFDPEGSAEIYFKTRTKHDQNLAKMTWGTCVPEACKPPAIVKILRTLLKTSHLGYFSEEADISITSCEVAGRKNEPHKDVYWFIFAFWIMFIIACLSTYYTMLYYKPEMKSYFQETIRSFSFRRNIDIIKNAQDDEIHILNIMRVVSIVIIVPGHLYFLLYGGMVVNGLRIDEYIDMGFGYLIQGDLVMDTYFTISGLLLVRGFFKGKWANPIKYLTKRYLRIASGLAVIIYVKTRLFYYMNDGPFWPKLAGPEHDACVKNWWQTFTLTSNYFTGNEACYILTWCFPVDFHMSVIGAILCYMYRKSKHLTMFAFWILLSIAVITPGYISYIRELPHINFYGIESLRNYRENVLMLTSYVTTHTRAGTFLIGMVLGYIFAHYKPANYRKVITKKWSYLLIIMSLIVMGTILVVGYNLYLKPNRLGIAFFSSMHRNTWSVMVAIIITVCEYGDLGVLKDLISWSPLVPLSRLTVTVFFIHMMLIERNVMSVRAPYRWDQLSLTEEGIGILLLSFMGSFILWLLVEAPSVNLASIFLDGMKTEKSKEVKKSAYSTTST